MLSQDYIFITRTYVVICCILKHWRFQLGKKRLCVQIETHSTQFGASDAIHQDQQMMPMTVVSGELTLKMYKPMGQVINFQQNFCW